MGARLPSKTAVANEGFSPSVSTTLEAFTGDGSDTLLRRLIYDLLSLSNVMLRNRGHFAAYIGVTDQQFMIMTLLHETPGAAVSRIAKQFSVSSQFVTIEVGKLIKQGIVEKRASEQDRRSVALSLTARGDALLREVWPIRRRTNDVTFRSFTPERARLMHEMVGTLLQDAKTALHDLESPQMRGRHSPLLDADPPPASAPASRRGGSREK